jgi:hypothetical protein
LTYGECIISSPAHDLRGAAIALLLPAGDAILLQRIDRKDRFPTAYPRSTVAEHENQGD